MPSENAEQIIQNSKFNTQNSLSGESWRLLITTGSDGAANMALDNAILEQVGAGVSPPTLRLFDWNPTCLTLGIAQPHAEVDLVRLQERGWDITRRPTGGKAILHTGEITYSITLPADHPLAQGDILTSYRRLSRGLLRGLERLGLRAGASPGGAPISEADKGPVCFEVPSNYEITANGHKLIGSAQVRKSGAVLQHGSLPLGGDIALICDALVFPHDAARETAKIRVRERATTLESALGHAVAWDEAADALVAAFAETFDLVIGEPESPSAAEQTRADELRAEKYAADQWIQRR